MKISEIVDNPNYKNSKLEVISLNPNDFSIELKEVTDLVKHKAPSIMYKVISESGREIIVTKDHNVYVLRNGELKLLETEKISTNDYIPLPIKLNTSVNLKNINLFELLKKEKDLYVLFSKNIIKKLKNKKECLKILEKIYFDPSKKYDDFFLRKKRIRITILSKLLQKKIPVHDLLNLKITDKDSTLVLKSIFPLTKDFLQLLGYYIAEGYCLNNNSFRISCSNKQGKFLLNNIFENLGLNYFWIKKNGLKTDVGISSSIFTKILINLNLGRVAGEKRLPYFFMGLSNDDLAILLKTYFEGDGGVDKGRVITNKNFCISSTTKSKKLASDIAFALYKYGILTRTKKTWKKATNTNHEGNYYYRVKISGKPNIKFFLTKVGFQFSTKNDVLVGKLEHKENTNVNLIPCDYSKFKKIRLALRLDQATIAKMTGCSQGIISAAENDKRKLSYNLFSKSLKSFEKRFKEFDEKQIKKLIVFSKISDFEKVADLINNERKRQNLTLFELGKKSKLYGDSSNKYIINDLNRILVSKKVKNSPKIFVLGKSILNDCSDFSGLNELFEYDYQGWKKLIREMIIFLNFPNQSMKTEKANLGYYARKIKKNENLSLINLKKLANLILKYYNEMIEVIPLFEEMKKLLNFKWDKIKKIEKIDYNKPYVYDLTIKDNHTFFAGHSGLFVHNSNLMKDILWDSLDKEYVGTLVMDPHDEYYGRSELGLKNHHYKQKLVYYTPVNPPPGARRLIVNLESLKPEYFQGAVQLSDPQRQALYAYYKKFKERWVTALLNEENIDGVRFHEDTLAVVKRKLMALLNIRLENEKILSEGIFQEQGGENTISDLCRELEASKTVILDTSFFSGALEVMVASMVASDMLNLYKRYTREGILKEKPVVSIVLEEAPRVLGKKVLEQGTNIFDTIAREGRKFQVGILAITQLPSEIPKSVLANMNTKIILGIEMGAERNAVIESAAQDLSSDSRAIASLDKGEAIVTSIFTRFAVPLIIPFYPEFVEERKKNIKKENPSSNVQTGFMGI